MQIERYEMPFIRSNMYIAVENEHVLIIDPVQSKEAFQFLQQIRAEKALILLTHEHCDHTNGVNGVRELFHSHLICTELCALAIANVKNNRLHVVMGLLDTYPREVLKEFCHSIGNYTCTADKTFTSSLDISWLGHEIHLQALPGHSPGSCCIELDNSYVFTGDSLIPGVPVITGFPGGSAEDYERITLPYLRALSPNVQVMPGHGVPCIMKEFYQNDQRFACSS